MGAHLVAQVLTRWTHVSDRAFRVLVRMALTSLDKPSEGRPAGVYFGGRDLLAMTLRAERGGDQEAVYRTVRKAIAELVKEGVIERTNTARAGNNQVYRLRLNAPRSVNKPAVDNQVEGDSSGPPQGDSSGPPQGDSSGPPQADSSGSSRGTSADPPRNHEEPREELCEEREAMDVRTAVTVARASDAAKDPIFDVNDSGEPVAPADCCEHRVPVSIACPDCRRRSGLAHAPVEQLPPRPRRPGDPDPAAVAAAASRGAELLRKVRAGELRPEDIALPDDEEGPLATVLEFRPRTA